MPQHGDERELSLRVLRNAVRFAVFSALVAGLLLSTVAPAAAAGTETEWESVFRVAKNQIGDRWVHYARGPDKFDCVGFVFFVYNQNGLKDRIGGYRSVKGYYNWFRERGRADLSNPRPGDLVIWGRFQHIGMYIGDGKAISALVNPYGVKIHAVKGYINMKVKAYLHVRLER